MMLVLWFGAGPMKHVKMRRKAAHLLSHWRHEVPVGSWSSGNGSDSALTDTEEGLVIMKVLSCHKTNGRSNFPTTWPATSPDLSPSLQSKLEKWSELIFHPLNKKPCLIKNVVFNFKPKAIQSEKHEKCSKVLYVIIYWWFNNLVSLFPLLDLKNKCNLILLFLECFTKSINILIDF